MSKGSYMVRKKEEKETAGKEGLTESLKKLAYMGAGTLFMTQEGLIKTVADQLKLPKEAATALVGQVDRARHEAIQTIGSILSGYLESLDLIDLIKKIADGMEVEVKASFRIGFDKASTPRKGSARTKRKRPSKSHNKPS